VTFGLDMILYNLMNVGFEATPRRITLDLGSLLLGPVVLAWDRVVAMGLALAFTRCLVRGAAGIEDGTCRSWLCGMDRMPRC
jgi:hypothetical protein